MQIKMFPFSIAINRVKLITPIPSIIKNLRWRWISIFLLATVGHLLISAIFNYQNQRALLSFNLEDYFNVLIASLILLETTRLLASRINQISSNVTDSQKRKFIQSSVRLLFILVLLNTLVVSITYIFYSSFYDFSELAVVNISIVPLAFLFTRLDEKLLDKNSNWQHDFGWRWISIFSLGICSNTLINTIFDYKYQRPLVSLSVEEYVNAIIASWVLLAGTRWISRKLDVKLPWEQGVMKRLSIQLPIQLAFIILLLNALLISITYFIYGGFYAFDELMIINLSVVSLTFFFSIIDISIYFFKRWKRGADSSNGNQIISYKPIQMSLGKSKYLVQQEQIRCAISDSGLVMIITEEQRRLPYSESLEALMKKLTPQRFFRANRQTVLSHSVVQSIKSLDYGKIEVALIPSNGQPESIIISRTKASEFRKWLKLQTV